MITRILLLLACCSSAEATGVRNALCHFGIGIGSTYGGHVDEMAHMSSARALVRFPSLLRKRRSFRVVIKQITIGVGKPGHTAGLADQPWSTRTRRARVCAQSPAAEASLFHIRRRLPRALSLFPLGMGLLPIVFQHHTGGRCEPELMALRTVPH
jgi:hypothetical protein